MTVTWRRRRRRRCFPSLASTSWSVSPVVQPYPVEVKGDGNLGALYVVQCRDQVVRSPNMSGLQLFTVRFIYSDMHKIFTTACTQSKHRSWWGSPTSLVTSITMERSPQHVYTRWQPWHILPTAGFKRKHKTHLFNMWFNNSWCFNYTCTVMTFVMPRRPGLV